MGALDFLFEGKSPPAVTTSGTTVQNMPKWLSDYTQGIISQASAVAAEPYQQYEGPRLAGLTPDQLKAFDIARSSTGQTSNAIQGAINQPGALSAAQPYLDKAGGTYTGENVNKYMDPYVSNVIDRAGTLAQRQLNEKLLPSVYGTFGGAGQDSRSTEMRKVVDRGTRDLTEGLNEQALGALSGAYTAGGTQFNADQSRQGTLAQYAGTLAGNERGQTADLAKSLQAANAGDVSMLGTTGGVQQADTQKSLDLAYGDFQAQRDYPKTQLDWLRNAGTGVVSAPQDKTTVSQGPLAGSEYGANTISQMGSTAAGVKGIWDMFNPPAKQARRGGRINFRRGGALRYAHA